MKRILLVAIFALHANAQITPEQQAWRALIDARMREWPSQAELVAREYAPAEPPSRVTILIENNGERDAMTRDAQTIVFDATALQNAYGDATTSENRNRIDRLFRHEFAHLMQKSWLRTHPYDAPTSFRAALLGVWLEGLGVHFSMSDKWRGDSSIARETLAKLEPRFVARMTALACASPDDAAKLMADLNEGPFAEKWGSLPLALWLDAEGEGAYRELVIAGPDAVIEIAKRHLAIEHARQLDEAVAMSRRCR